MTAFVPLANMTRELDALMPDRGPCGFCGGPDARHRLIDAIRENARAGDDPRTAWGPPDYPEGMVDAVLALRPIRVQRSRAKGARTPWGTIYVGRPSRWGNRMPTGPGIDRMEAIRRFRLQAAAAIDCQLPRDWLAPLRDATALSCWCPLVDANGQPVPCHADVLIELLGGTP